VCLELTFTTENVVGYFGSGTEFQIAIAGSSDKKCSVAELGSRSWYSETAAARRTQSPTN